MFEQAFRNIDDVLWKDAGCTSELARRLAGIYRRKLAALEELKQALLVRAFAGEL